MTKTQQIALGEDRREQQPWATPGEFFSAVMRAGRASVATSLDPRLRPLATAVGASPAGGFAIPEAVIGPVLAASAEDDPTAGRMMNIPMGEPIVHLTARVDKNHTTSVSGGFKVYRQPPETPTLVTTSRGEYERVTGNASKPVIGLTFADNLLVEASMPAFAAVLTESFRDEFASSFLEERFRGTGVDQMAGILTSPALIIAPKENGQAAATITGENVLAMRRRVWRYRRAVWIANHDALPQLMKLAVPNGTGATPVPAWAPGDDENGIPDQLLGRPLFYAEAASTLGEVGDLMCVNWSQYLNFEYRPLQTVSSVHVRWQANETAFRFTQRVDGAPWWRAPLTPRRSSLTLSPFVALEARA